MEYDLPVAVPVLDEFDAGLFAIASMTQLAPAFGLRVNFPVAASDAGARLGEQVFRNPDTTAVPCPLPTRHPPHEP
jgi:hypothetical protein